MARAVPESEKTDEIAGHHQQDIMTSLSQAAHLGHSEAMNELKKRARQKQPLAQLGVAGINLAKDKTPAGFYSAMNELEHLVTQDQALSGAFARNILLRRARNAGKIFIHADIDSVEILAQQQSTISADNEHLLTSKQLYLWGLRHLYGVEGVKHNRREALRLLQIAEKRGGGAQAGIRISVIEKLPL